MLIELLAVSGVFLLGNFIESCGGSYYGSTEDELTPKTEEEIEREKHMKERLSNLNNNAIARENKAYASKKFHTPEEVEEHKKRIAAANKFGNYLK